MLMQRLNIREEDQLAQIKRNVEMIRSLLAEADADALVAGRQNMFGFISAGEENIVNADSSGGSCILVLTRSRNFVVASKADLGTIDASLFQKAGFEICGYNWGGPETPDRMMRELAGSDRIVSDGGNGRNLYSRLLEKAGILNEYQKKLYFLLARDVGDALNELPAQVKPGLTERAVSAYVQYLLAVRGIHADVLLVGSDERAARARHFLSTDRKICRRVMLIGCFRRNGLVLSLTRDIYFGRMEEGERLMHRRLNRVAAQMLDVTRPDRRYRELYEAYGRIFQENGLEPFFPEHPAAGLTGYEARVKWIGAESGDAVRNDRAYAFNPCIGGYKSEDTFLLEDGCFRMLSDDRWPSETYDFQAGSYRRPLPLEL